MITITIQIDDATPFRVLEIAQAVINDADGGTCILLPLGMSTELKEGDKLVPLFRLPDLEDDIVKLRPVVRGEIPNEALEL